MRSTHPCSSALLALTLTFVSAPAALAASPSSADLATIRNYTLTGDFLATWQAIQRDAAKGPCNLGIMSVFNRDNDEPESLDQMASRYDAQPGVHAMLSRHGLTAHAYLLGAFTLFTAGMQDIAQQHPTMVSKGYLQTAPGFTVGATNMAFYRRHQANIHRQMQQLGQQQIQISGGKLPNCAG